MSDNKAVRCWMFAYPGTSVVGVDDDERNAIENADGLSPVTPAVAVTEEVYNRVRAALRKLRRSDLPWRAQPLWDELQAALSLLPEVPT